jgi:amino acid adenylation domain-containing protein/non-ribosomal peptide synthase protein (TIGR01720 family)
MTSDFSDNYSTEEEVFVFPASFGQQRLWFLEQLEPGSPFYNLANAVRLRGQLNVAALEKSLNEIVRRHEALRTMLTQVEGRIVQAIAPSLTLKLPIIELEGVSEERIQQLATEEARLPFVLSQFPLIRVKLLRLNTKEHVLLLTMHHAIADGWSMGILLQELAALYSAFVVGKPSPLPECQLQYADFTVWQQQWLQGEVFNKQLTYWKQQLNNLSPLQLPTDRSRAPVQTFRGETQSQTLSGQLTEALESLARQEGVTLFMLLLAAFGTLLDRYTGQEDIAIGSAIANRHHPESESLIGLFANALVMRVNVSGNPSFRELLGRVRQMTLEAYAHQDLPFEKLVDELQPERDLSRNPLFQVYFGVNNTPMPALELGELSLSPIAIDSRTSQFDLSLEIFEGEQTLTVAIEYSTDLFDAATITRMFGHFQTLLENIIADREKSLASLQLLTPSEEHQLLIEWGHGEGETERHGEGEKHGDCLHQLFEAQVKRTPDAIALIDRNQSLTYRELDRKANQLASYLQSLGIKPGMRVGILLSSFDAIASIWAILKIGGVYVPLDPDYPQERLAFMLTDAQVSVLLTQSHLLATLPKHSAQVVCLDTDSNTQKLSSLSPSLRVPLSPCPLNLAYIIYTSGSTGTPKGVMVSHRNLVSVYRAWENAYNLSAEPLIHLQTASLAFDVFAGDLVKTLCSGGTLVLCPKEILLQPEALYRLMRQQRINSVDLVPAVVDRLLNYLETTGQSLDFMRLLVVGSDRWYVRDYARLKAVCGCQTRLINAYGVSEATIDSTYFENDIDNLNPDRLVPIGRPFSNTQIYLLDTHLNPVPIGVPGELYLGGEGIARGYLNRPDLTAEKFIVNPFCDRPGERLYKTGDLARYLPDGNIEFLGRCDRQVKLRGIRIELAEIEAVLNRHSQIWQAVVSDREDGSGSKYLVAYLVLQQQDNPSPEPISKTLRNYLKERLPDYMIPSGFMVLAALPLSTNGKIDYRALPKPSKLESQAKFTLPRTEIERQLAAIWAEVLNLEQVGIYDNFFELGGDSILSIQVVAKANQQGLQLTSKQIFQYPCIAELATAVNTTEAVTAAQGLVSGFLPLTPIQQWFFEQNLSNPHHYNQANLLEIPASLDSDIIRQVLKQLLIHHDALRLRFELTNFGWQQFNDLPHESIPFVEIEIQQSYEINAIATQLQASLNLSTGSLLKVARFKLGENQSDKLFIAIHHLAVDAVSWQILLEDFRTAYRQIERGQPIQLPAKTTSFLVWAEKLKQYSQSAELKKELDYWLSEVNKSVSPLPVDFLGGANTVASSNMLSVTLSVEETQTLLQYIPTTYRSKIDEVLLTALGLTFAEWTGENSLLIDLEGHGREPLFTDVDISRTVGWFTSLFPVVLELGDESTVNQALKQVKQQLRSIPNGGIGYGLLRYFGGDEIAQPLRKLQAEVNFNYLGHQKVRETDSSHLLRLASDSIGFLYDPQGIRSYLLEIDYFIAGDRLQMDWTYSEAVHRHSTVENLAQGVLEKLRSLLARSDSPQTHSYAPSDFQAAKISPKDFNKLLNKLSKKD